MSQVSSTVRESDPESTYILHLIVYSTQQRGSCPYFLISQSDIYFFHSESESESSLELELVP